MNARRVTLIRFLFDARKVNAVILSHAHIDHSGRLPLLVQRGFLGPIHTHHASKALTTILPKDSANLAASQFRRSMGGRRTGSGANKEQVGVQVKSPLYDLQDVERTLPLFRSHPYRRWIDVAPGIKVRFIEAGHILGSSVVELNIHDEGRQKRIVLSGYLGQFDSPILCDPESPESADPVIMESTYGDRRHKDRTRSLLELGDLIRDANPKRSSIVVPAFAVGRSQELLYQLGKHVDEWRLSRWKIFLDSPLAIEASEIYWHHRRLFDEEALELRREFKQMPELRNVYFTRSAEDSKKISQLGEGAIIIAGSGTCGGGRILHHLKNNLPYKDNQFLFTGFQPPGGLERRLIEGADRVWIHGQSLDVNARTLTIGGLSAHGDYEDLLRWYRRIPGLPPLYMVHGDPGAMQSLQFRLTAARASAHTPEPGQRVAL